MTARWLAIVMIVGMALAPFLPSQRIYVCPMDGLMHMSCCCHPDGSDTATTGTDRSGCCKVIVVRQFLAPGHDAPQAGAVDIAPVAVELPAPILVAVVSWRSPQLAHRAQAPPERRPDHLFVRHCSWLT